MMRFAVISVAIAVALLGGGWYAIDRFAPHWGHAPLIYAVSVNFVAGWVAFLVISVVHKRWPTYVPQAALGGMVVRILSAGAALLIAMIWDGWNAMAVSVCMLSAYLAFLVAETWVTIQMVWRQFKTDEVK